MINTLTRFCFHGIPENAQKSKMQDQLDDEHKARLASTNQF